MDKLFDFTNITKKLGSSFEKIKRHNKLIDETRKQYNPTFLEIMEELKNDDKTLFNMMMVWYMSKNSIDDHDDIYATVENIIKKTQDYSNYGGSCGFDDDEDEEDDYGRMGGAC